MFFLQIAVNIHQGAKDAAETTARVALNSIPGRMVVGSLNLAVRASEKALDCVNATPLATDETAGPHGPLLRVRNATWD